MLTSADVPSYVVFERLDTVPGTTDDELPLRKHLPEVREILASPGTMMMVNASAGSGKSRLLPVEIQKFLEGKLLCLNPGTIDTKKVCAHARTLGCKACYRLGGRRSGGDPRKDSRIEFATVGLAHKWYSSSGTTLFDKFDGVFCDEFHEMESDPKYAALFEMFKQIAEKRAFRIVGASATMSTSLVTNVSKCTNVSWVKCHERPHPLERNIAIQCSAIYCHLLWLISGQT